ncbi:hypothetical protein BFZC1_00135 [Lysinibacillus fusiformis ZC1]|nr:hypothetical protein BFZC1_00135 [Lysinibacillus fusiformis ZC1]
MPCLLQISLMRKGEIMVKTRNPKGAGRKRKYDNPVEQTKLKNLVFLYREKHPSGIIKMADMVRFSEEMHKINSDEFPTIYKKDVWSSWGKEFINIANEPITIKIESETGLKLEIPNFSDIVEKYSHDKTKILEHLLPSENFLHESLAKNISLSTRNNELEERIISLKLYVNELEETIKKYQKMTLEMAHHSGVEKYRKKYGLINQISVSENHDAFDNLDNLQSFLAPKSDQNNNSMNNDVKDTGINKNDNVILANWKKLRN